MNFRVNEGRESRNRVTEEKKEKEKEKIRERELNRIIESLFIIPGSCDIATKISTCLYTNISTLLPTSFSLVLF